MACRKHSPGNPCCGCMTRAELPATITSPGATNTINRADWTQIGDCCFRGTFNFSNDWTRVRSDACYSHDGLAEETVSKYYRPYSDNGSTATRDCATLDALAVTNSPVRYSNPDFSVTETLDTRVYVLWRLARIVNNVGKTIVTCGGVTGVKYVWFTSYEFDYRYGQYDAYRLQTICEANLTDSCWDAFDSDVVVEVTEDDIWAGGISSDYSGSFNAVRTFSTMPSSSTETFEPRTILSCEDSVSCGSLPTSYSDYVFNSTTRSNYDWLGLYPSSINSTTTQSTGTINLWDAGSGLKAHVIKYANVSGHNSGDQLAGQTLSFCSGRQNRSNSSWITLGCAFSAPGCTVGGVITGNTGTLFYKTESHFVIDSRTVTYTEMSYTPKSAVIASPAWSISFA